jgi:hypothetical protein
MDEQTPGSLVFWFWLGSGLMIIIYTSPYYTVIITVVNNVLILYFKIDYKPEKYVFQS